MDFSPLTDALSSKSYGKIADICDELMLKGAAEMEGGFRLRRSGLLLFIFLPIFMSMILTAQDFSVHEAIRAFDWSQQIQPLVVAFSEVYTKRMFQLLLSAYSTIGIQDTALFLGMNEDDATNYVVQQGWVVDPDSRMLTVKKQPVKTEQKLDSSKLHRLTEYVFHLEH
ncbi:hypothetical protein OIU85_026882 [Salix viminalis]|uniref:CSN8/PSMD8/EIF3K domain-containing protein n=1 Tax=Salix viminalis TaxID=40686 RepID=A0A9Q0TPN0_SALVM|nr:hypothetical protein OIU85_026882 [Salix viminalis]